MAEAEAIIKAALVEEELEKKKRKKQKEHQGKSMNHVSCAHIHAAISTTLNNSSVSTHLIAPSSPPPPTHTASAAKADRKGLPVEQLEAQEDGPIKESLVAIAHKKRAFKRKAPSHLEDTDLAPDIEAAEEEEEEGGPSAGNDDDDNGGIKIEPFNMKEERSKGYFDEAGTYIEKGSEDEDDDDGEGGGEKDAWLQGDASRAVVSEEVRQKILARQKQQREQQQLTQSIASRQPLTATQIARLQWQVAKILHPGESITRAMKRLASQGTHRAIGKRAKQQTVILDPEAKKQLDELTDVANALMDAGDIDVYTQDREHFKTAASVYIDVDEDDDEKGGKGGGVVGGTAPYEEADDDMFADDDGDEDMTKKKEQEAEAAPTANVGRQEENVDYASWPVKELRKFLIDRSQDATMLLEKSELVAAVEKLGSCCNSAAGTAAVGSVKARQAVQVPVGFAYDPSSGYWCNNETGMYFDPGSGYYFHNEKWYRWDGQQYVEIVS